MSKVYKNHVIQVPIFLTCFNHCYKPLVFLNVNAPGEPKGDTILQLLHQYIVNICY